MTCGVSPQSLRSWLQRRDWHHSWLLGSAGCSAARERRRTARKGRGGEERKVNEREGSALQSAVFKGFTNWKPHSGKMFSFLLRKSYTSFTLMMTVCWTAWLSCCSQTWLWLWVTSQTMLHQGPSRSWKILRNVWHTAAGDRLQQQNAIEFLLLWIFNGFQVSLNLYCRHWKFRVNMLDFGIWMNSWVC